MATLYIQTLKTLGFVAFEHYMGRYKVYLHMEKS